MSYPDRKIIASIDGAVDLAEKISVLLSFGTNNSEVYKKVLRCRLEVQYALALLCLNYRTECRPQRVRGKPEMEKDIQQITDHLLKCKDLLSSGRAEDAVKDLLAADALLGHLIIWLRREKKVPWDKPSAS
ncbi:MAG: hypothetical protein FJZ49_03050 [Candidatus Verstraetearchaeota archaeon]|nr:hypothetical protein [Candidatus Verstraetearchaeota archaeon]